MNWVDPSKLDLTCKDKYLLSAMGSLYFVGFAISSGFAPLAADKFGRKRPYLTCLLVQTSAYILIFFSPNVYITIWCYLFVGLCAGGRVSIGINYMNEFV